MGLHLEDDRRQAAVQLKTPLTFAELSELDRMIGAGHSGAIHQHQLSVDDGRARVLAKCAKNRTLRVTTLAVHHPALPKGVWTGHRRPSRRSLGLALLDE